MHSTEMPMRTLEVAKENGFEFDTVQMPLNVMDAHYRSFEKLVLPELVKQNIGVLGMKALANGTILESKTVSAIECLQYAMNLPTSVVITGCESMEDLEQALTAARTFKPISDEEIKALLSSGWARNHQKFSESCKQDSHKKAQKTQNRKAKKFIERV